MTDKFTPYLSEVLPPILAQASLRAEMKIQGQEEGTDIQGMLEEVGNVKEKKANIMTDEIEEKDSAIQMLVVFIDELGTGFAPYIEKVAGIFMSLTQFYASDNIRCSSAGALPSLIKCFKEANPANIEPLHVMAKAYSNNILDAMETETETECLIAQAQAIKEILEETGEGLLQENSVKMFSQKIFEFLQQSENREQDNQKYEKENMDGEEEDRLDEEDLAVLKEENKNEHELQISLAEIFGALFKTHREFCRELVGKLWQEVLPNAAKLQSKHSMKFILFILDDMVEFLGAEFLGSVYPEVVF